MDHSDGTQTPMTFMSQQCPPADIRVCLQSHASQVDTRLYGKTYSFKIPRNICVYFYTEHKCVYRGEPENFFRLCSEMGTFTHQSYQALKPDELCYNYLLESGELIYPDKRPNGWANLNILVNDLSTGSSKFFTTPEHAKSHIFLKDLIEELVSIHSGKKISVHLLMCRVNHIKNPKKDIGEEIKLQSGRDIAKGEALAVSGLLSFPLSHR